MRVFLSVIWGSIGILELSFYLVNLHFAQDCHIKILRPQSFKVHFIGRWMWYNIEKKEFFQIVWALIKWGLLSALILVLGILIFGSNLPGIFAVVSMLIAAAIVFPNSKSVKRKKNVLSSENQKSITYDPDKEFKIPLSQKKREALAQSILDNIQTNIKLANRSEVFVAFIAWYDDVWSDTWKLTLNM